jgi:hypothetical protein
MAERNLVPLATSGPNPEEQLIRKELVTRVEAAVAILPRLGQQNYVRRNRGSREEHLRDNRLRLGAMDVPLVAELGRTKPAGRRYHPCADEGRRPGDAFFGRQTQIPGPAFRRG